MTSPKPPRSAGIRLVEWSRNDEDEGGEQTQAYDVMVNDDWMSLSQLKRLGTVDGITATADDNRGSRIPPGYQWRWPTYVEGPIGMRIRKRTSRPDRELALRDVWARGVPRVADETIFRLLRGGRIQEENAAEQDEREERTRASEAREAPMAPDEIARRAAEIVAMLEAPPPSCTNLLAGPEVEDQRRTA
jgi:hypothetical protein